MPVHTHKTSAASAFVTTLLYIATALFAGLLVFASYQFEVSAYQALLGTLGDYRPFQAPRLTTAELLALGMNGAKITLVFTVVDQAARFGGRAGAVKILRLLVLSISLVMTLLVVGGQTISPYAQQKLEAAKAVIQADFDTKVAGLAQDRSAAIAQIAAYYATEVENLRLTHDAYIAEKTALLDHERGIGGQNFKGAVYTEIQALIDTENANYVSRTSELRADQLEETQPVDAAFQVALQNAEAEKQAAIANLGFSTMFSSSEAQHPYMLRAQEMIRSIYPEFDNTTLITIAIAVMMSFGIELTPMLLFSHLFRVLSGHKAAKRPHASADPLPSPTVVDLPQADLTEDARGFDRKSA